MAFRLKMSPVRRSGLLLLGVLLCSVVLAADDRTVLFDEDVDFSKFKTFAVADGHVQSNQPDLNSPITIKKITDAIRSALIAKKLTEGSVPADLTVQFNVTTKDYEIGPFGGVNPLGGRGRGRGPASTREPDLTDATLVIDFRTAGAGELVWRGVYNDTENGPAKVAEALPKDALNLLADFPPKKKR
jgi:Domain of unknown function (DUF4136)